MNNLHRAGGNWWTSIDDYVYSGIKYVVQLKLSILPEGLHVFRGERWLPTSYYISEWAYNKIHLLYALRLVPYTSNRTPLTVVSGMLGTHCKHNPLVSSSVFNNNLSYLYIDACELGR